MKLLGGALRRLADWIDPPEPIMVIYPTNSGVYEFDGNNLRDVTGSFSSTTNIAGDVNECN